MWLKCSTYTGAADNMIQPSQYLFINTEEKLIFDLCLASSVQMLNTCKSSPFSEDLFKTRKNSKYRCEARQANTRASDIPLNQNVLRRVSLLLLFTSSADIPKLHCTRDASP